TLRNGIQQEQTSYNDARQPTTKVDCPVVAGAATTSSGNCPTVASSTSSVSCTGSGYYAYTLHDGTGFEHSLVAFGSAARASVSAVQGSPTYSGDLLQYGYAATATASSGGTLAAASSSSSWTRDLQGLPLTMALSVTDASNTTTTFSSDTYTYNSIGEPLSELNKLSQSGRTTLHQTYGPPPHPFLHHPTPH